MIAICVLYCPTITNYWEPYVARTGYPMCRMIIKRCIFSASSSGEVHFLTAETVTSSLNTTCTESHAFLHHLCGRFLVVVRRHDYGGSWHLTPYKHIGRCIVFRTSLSLSKCFNYHSEVLFLFYLVVVVLIFISHS